MRACDLTSAFDDLARRGPWTGADSTASVPLSDGRTVWLFSDTMLGSIRPDGSRDPETPMVHNSAVIQEGDTLTPFFGGIPGRPMDRPMDLIPLFEHGEYAWIGAGRAADSGIDVLLNTYRTTGPGQFDFACTGTMLGALDLLTLRPILYRQVEWTGRIAWGSAIFETADALYVYGSEFDPWTKRRYAHLAWLPSGNLNGPWMYWTRYGWSREQDRSSPILSGVGTAFGVQRVGDQVALVTMDCRQPFPGQVVAYLFDSPESPPSDPVRLCRVPELTGNGDRIAYDARVHPHLAEPGQLLISYNVHSLDPQVLFRDASVYRPRFVEHSCEELARAYEYMR
jgi:hypothetical protein